MRAAVAPALNEKLEVFDDVVALDPGPAEVRVRIAASGICHSDLSALNGVLPQPLPAVLGHEGSGEILEVGSAVTNLKAGDHVILAWTAPCGACRDCLHGQPNLCMVNLLAYAPAPRFRRGEEMLFGFAGTGTFAEEIVVPASAAIPIGKDVPLEIASLIGCGVTTGVGAVLNTASLRPGSSVVVFGCGGVGMSVIQGARIAGAAEIVAVDLRESKFELARHFGATHATKPDGLNEVSASVTGGLGFDYAFEVIGIPATVRSAYDATRRGGSTVIVGAGSMEHQITFNGFELFYSEKKILPSFYGSADVRTDFERMIRLWRTGKLDLESMITKRIGLEDINEGFDVCRSGDAIRTVVEFT